MATVEIFMQETGAAEFMLFLVAQVCMMAAAGVVGYMIGRHKYAEGNVSQTEVRRMAGMLVKISGSQRGKG